MPNNVINHVEVSGPNAEEIMKKYFRPPSNDDEVLTFDFESIIPTPKDADWYNFHCSKWGTKWNSYDLELETYSKFKFQTAWSTPHPIFIKLSKMEPTLIFHVDYADEDIGSNCGSYTIEDGKEIETRGFPHYSNVSRQFARTLWGWEEDDEEEEDEDGEDEEDEDGEDEEDEEDEEEEQEKDSGQNVC